VQFASVLAAVLVSVLINSMREPESQETRGITVSTPPNA
jgi:hypothetical protein